MQPLLFCQYFFKFFYFFCPSLLSILYYIQLSNIVCIFFNFFLVAFLLPYLLYTISICLGIICVNSFLKILLFSISCNLYIGLTMPFFSHKKFLNFLLFSIALKNSYIIQEKISVMLKKFLHYTGKKLN